METREEESIKNLLLRPIKIPNTLNQTIGEFIDGQVTLCLRGQKGLFKYGKGVYDIARLQTILKVGENKQRYKYTHIYIYNSSGGDPACVRACVRVSVRVYVRAYVHACVRACVCMCVYV